MLNQNTRFMQTTCTMILSAIDRLLTALFPVRRGRVECGCKEVQLSLILPPSSYCFVSQTCAACYCGDCIGFANAVRTRGEAVKCRLDVIDPDTKCVDMVQFYQSDVKVVQGNENIVVCKVRSDTPVRRFFCGKCCTPLAIEMGPITILYRKLLSNSSVIDKNEKPLPKYRPQVGLFFAKADPDTKPLKGIVVRQGVIAPLFLIRVLTRLFLGLILGKGRHPDYGFSKSLPKSVIPLVGLEQICTIDNIDEDIKKTQ